MADSTGALRYGDRAAREVSRRAGGDFATTALVQALGPKARAGGMIVTVTTQPWIFIAGNTDGASATCLVPDDVTSNVGRWKTSANATALEQSTKPVAAGTAAVGAGGTASDSAHVHPPYWSGLPYAGDALPATTLAETVIAAVSGTGKITALDITPTGAVTASDTVYATITIKARDGIGGTAATVATLVTNVAGGSWTAFTKKSMGAITNGTLAAGYLLTMTIAKASTGTTLPSFVITPTFG